ncbi:hypothetical protein PIB30_029907 [Stylosanthes scabra]|uniref:Uncharacterized protein n=1 Tax=Stylosanthes scabra TaxID=79078 RepID=A0ABU6SC05_9FABA|nr:hypothetical protein [Stylosanthes scabra]
MFFIRLYPNGVTNSREDGIWFQCQSIAVFQHPRISTLQELKHIVLSNLNGRFREKTKVGYRFLSPQPNKRSVIAGSIGDGVEAECGSSDSDSDYLGESDSSSD